MVNLTELEIMEKTYSVTLTEKEIDIIYAALGAAYGRAARSLQEFKYYESRDLVAQTGVAMEKIDSLAGKLSVIKSVS